MVLFFVGILEMIVITFWTKLVTKTQVFASGAVTMINVLIWYYVLQQIVDDIANWRLVIIYALGCSIGTVISTYFFRYRESAAGSKLGVANTIVNND